MNTNDFLVIELVAAPAPEDVRWATIHHGDELNGRNLIAVLEGVICASGECVWCDDLRTRCQSRRIA